MQHKVTFHILSTCLVLYITGICTHMHGLVGMYSNIYTVHTYGCIYNDGVGPSKVRDPRSTEQQQFTTRSKLQCCQVEYDMQLISAELNGCTNLNVDLSQKLFAAMQMINVSLHYI